MNACQTHVIMIAIALTTKVPLTVNVILGILEMALIALVSTFSAGTGCPKKRLPFEVKH